MTAPSDVRATLEKALLVAASLREPTGEAGDEAAAREALAVLLKAINRLADWRAPTAHRLLQACTELLGSATPATPGEIAERLEKALRAELDVIAAETPPPSKIVRGWASGPGSTSGHESELMEATRRQMRARGRRTTHVVMRGSEEE